MFIYLCSHILFYIPIVDQFMVLRTISRVVLTCSFASSTAFQTVNVELPKSSFARLVFGSRHFHEEFVQRQIVSNGILGGEKKNALKTVRVPNLVLSTVQTDPVSLCFTFQLGSAFL